MWKSVENILSKFLTKSRTDNAKQLSESSDLILDAFAEQQGIALRSFMPMSSVEGISDLLKQVRNRIEK